MSWWSFSAMRGDDEPRAWLRWSELFAWAKQEFEVLTVEDVRKALRDASRPERRYGHNHYTAEHVEAVRAYADREGYTRKGVWNGRVG